MADFSDAGGVSEMSNGTMKEVSLEGKPILIARVDDEFYATQGRCAHMSGNLSKGKLEGTVVTCPRHGSQFDLKNGTVVRWLKGQGLFSAIGKAMKSPVGLKTYEVKTENDRILVKVE